MNYSEILDVLKDKVESVTAFAYGDFGIPTGRYSVVYVEGVGACEEVAQKGGEDEGSEWYSVKYFPDHDIYIRVDGYYSSYNGTDFYDGWANCKEVRPKEKVIIVYE